MTWHFGKRRSLILEIGRWRFRATLGRFRSGWEHDYRWGGHSGLIATPLLLVTFLQKAQHAGA